MPKKLAYHDEDGNPYELVDVKDGTTWHQAFLIEGGPASSLCTVRWTSTDCKQQVHTYDINFQPVSGRRSKRGANARQKHYTCCQNYALQQQHYFNVAVDVSLPENSTTLEPKICDASQREFAVLELEAAEHIPETSEPKEKVKKLGIKGIMHDKNINDERTAVRSCSQSSPSATTVNSAKSRNATSSIQARGRQMNRKIDTDKPLKNISALHHFCKDVYKHVNEICPVKIDRKKFWEQVKLQFDFLPENERQVYVKRATKDKKRYHDQMAEYEAREKTESSLDATNCYVEKVTNQIDEDLDTSMNQICQETSIKKDKVNEYNEFVIDSEVSILTPRTSTGGTSGVTRQPKLNGATFDATSKAINTSQSSSNDHSTIKNYHLKSKFYHEKTTGNWKVYFYYDKHRCLGSFASRVEANRAFEILRKKLNQSNFNSEESIDELLVHVRDSLRNTTHDTTKMKRKKDLDASTPKTSSDLTSVKSNKKAKKHTFRADRVTAERNKSYYTWIASFHYDKPRQLGNFNTREEANLALEVMRNKLEESSAHTSQSIDEAVRLTRDIVSSRGSATLKDVPAACVANKTTENHVSEHNSSIGKDDASMNANDHNEELEAKNTATKSNEVSTNITNSNSNNSWELKRSASNQNSSGSWQVYFYYDKFRTLGSYKTREMGDAAFELLKTKLATQEYNDSKSLDELVHYIRSTIRGSACRTISKPKKKDNKTTTVPEEKRELKRKEVQELQDTLLGNSPKRSKRDKPAISYFPLYDDIDFDDSISISSESGNRKQKQPNEKESHLHDLSTVPKNSKTSDKKDLSSKAEGRKKLKDAHSKHDYDDYSLVSYEDVSCNCLSMFSEKREGGKMLFPEKLHALLSHAEISDPDIVSWAPHGRCFSISNREKFFQKLLIPEFHIKTFSAFQRQLNRYNFKTITKGGSKDIGSYYHELFLRGRPSLSQCLRVIKIKNDGFRSVPDPQDEPDFYSFPYCYEVNRGLESNNPVSSKSDSPVASDDLIGKTNPSTLQDASQRSIIANTEMPISTNQSALSDPSTIKKYKFKRVQVYQREGSDKWKAYFYYDKYRKLGSFATRDEAYDAIAFLRNKLYQSNLDDEESIDGLVAFVRDSLKIKRNATSLKSSTPISIESTNGMRGVIADNQSKQSSLVVIQPSPEAHIIPNEKAKEGIKLKVLETEKCKESDQKRSEGLAKDDRKLDVERKFKSEDNTDMLKDKAKEEIIRFNSDLAENPDLTFNELTTKIRHNFENILLSKEHMKSDLKFNLQADKASISNNKFIAQKPHKQKDDADVPCENSVPYIYFSNFIREEMKAKHPDASFYELENLMRLEFKKLTSDDLKVFEELAAKDKNRHRTKIVEHEARQKTEASLKDDTICNDEKVDNQMEDKLNIGTSQVSQELLTENGVLNEWIV